MAKENQLTVQETRELLLNPAYQAQKTFEMQQRMAQMYVQSTIVPSTYRGNIGNCVIAIDMAQRMSANPLMVMQNLYIVNGNPSWSSKFLISCINMCGRFTPLRYQFVGKRGTQQYGCRAYAYEKADKEHKEPLCSVWVTMEMAEKEGWTKKSGSKWLTIPDQMLIYRAAAFWSRAYAPEISMGFLTKEEAEDYVDYEEVDSAPALPSQGDIAEPSVEVEDEDAADTATEKVQAPAQAATPFPKSDNPADAVTAAMKKQGTSRKTTYKAPTSVETADGQRVDTETGELFGKEEQNG
jgi:hypothetical protein